MICYLLLGLAGLVLVPVAIGIGALLLVKKPTPEDSYDRTIL
jgi:hypothetical protein